MCALCVCYARVCVSVPVYNSSMLACKSVQMCICVYRHDIRVHVKQF